MPIRFQALRLNEEKIRIVLNKADMIDTDQMMRVHGSLMWSLGRVFETPEVVRVYIREVGPYDYFKSLNYPIV